MKNEGEIFLFSLFGGIFIGYIYALIVMGISQTNLIMLEPVEDTYRNKILYYIDTNTHKTYKLSGDVLYCDESEEK